MGGPTDFKTFRMVHAPKTPAQNLNTGCDLECLLQGHIQLARENVILSGNVQRERAEAGGYAGYGAGCAHIPGSIDGQIHGSPAQFQAICHREFCVIHNPRTADTVCV